MAGKTSARTLFCFAGWVLAALLAGLILPRAYHRLLTRWPSLQRNEWRQTMEHRQQELSLPWQDSRPLHLLFGDSQIELGNWYELFNGAGAVRNCGLSRAKIQDVAELAAAAADRNPETVATLCGINNLGGSDSVEFCAGQYERLLLTIRTNLRPRKLLVLSVMPVRQSPVDQASRRLNRQVAEFNERLKQLCLLHQAVFLDLNPAIADTGGGLAENLTSDGLHLNPRGYQSVARLLGPSLAAGTNQP